MFFLLSRVEDGVSVCPQPLGVVPKRRAGCARTRAGALCSLGSHLHLASPGAGTRLAGLGRCRFELSPLLRALAPATPTLRENLRMAHLWVHSRSPLLSAAMNSCVCLCVLMAVLAARALAQPVPPAHLESPGAQQEEEAPRRQLRAAQTVDSEPRAYLGALLTRYIQHARKGTDAASPSLVSAPARGSPS